MVQDLNNNHFVFEMKAKALSFAFDKHRAGYVNPLMNGNSHNLTNIIKDAELIYEFLSKSAPDTERYEYTEADLVSFGNYMVSEERRDLYATHPDYANIEMLVERLSQVHHADIENWKDKRKGGEG